MKINWKWPSTPDNTYAPWYQCAWRLIWFIPYSICIAFAVACLYISQGKSKAIRLLKDAK